MIIGTPNGYGTAWMLINREYEIGAKVIDQVNIFGADDNALSFVFRIADAPQ